MAVLPASAEPVTTSPEAPSGRLRTLVLGGAGLALVLAVVPPVVTLAHRNEYVETIQFALVAFAVPALFVLGQPLRFGRPGRIAGALVHLASARRRHPWVVRSFAFAIVYVGMVIAWRTPTFVNALQRDPWLLPLELVTLIPAGVLLWAELVACPPLEPRLAPPWRAVLAAASMWGVWIIAYLVGFSHVAWYVAYHHPAGGLNATEDQELSTAIMWFGAAVSFVPVAFIDLLTWLRNGEDPDAELRALVRRERRWGGPKDL